jgi:hypothetical protein
VQMAKAAAHTKDANFIGVSSLKAGEQ